MLLGSDEGGMYVEDDASGGGYHAGYLVLWQWGKTLISCIRLIICLLTFSSLRDTLSYNQQIFNFILKKLFHTYHALLVGYHLGGLLL